jgi:hypothetical protein
LESGLQAADELDSPFPFKCGTPNEKLELTIIVEPHLALHVNSFR